MGDNWNCWVRLRVAKGMESLTAETCDKTKDACQVPRTMGGFGFCSASAAEALMLSIGKVSEHPFPPSLWLIVVFQLATAIHRLSKVYPHVQWKVRSRLVGGNET